MSVFDGLRFRKVSSPIHNLDPRIKFVYVIGIFVVAISLPDYPVVDFVLHADSVCFVGSCSKTMATFTAWSGILGDIHLCR